MEYEVTSDFAFIDFYPATELEEILQNIRTIISTPKYSVPLNREFGITMSWLDDPLPVARARLIAEIISEVKKQEPRVKVTQVTFEENARQGVIFPKVRVMINGYFKQFT